MHCKKWYQTFDVALFMSLASCKNVHSWCRKQFEEGEYFFRAHFLEWVCPFWSKHVHFLNLPYLDVFHIWSFFPKNGNDFFQKWTRKTTSPPQNVFRIKPMTWWKSAASKVSYHFLECTSILGWRRKLNYAISDGGVKWVGHWLLVFHDEYA